MDKEKLTSEEVQKILEKYDKEAIQRTPKGFFLKLIIAIAITFSIFQLYTAAFGVLDAMIQRSVHLAFGLALIYLLYPMSKKWRRDKVHLIDVALAALAVFCVMYGVVNYKELVLRAGIVTRMDFVMGLIGILLVLEAARRVVGLPITIVAGFFIVYAIYGRYFPGLLAHRGVSLQRLVGHLFYTTEGIFGIPLGVSSTFVFLFILLSAFLEKTGLGQLFIDLANSIAGRASGGPAKVAVFSSALMGTISGSSVANTVGTGSFTIPMMKKIGYKPEFAAAVEAAASTGGQLMPPIMGAAAFLMAEFTGISYGKIIIAAAIPAILYFFGVWMGVHWEAKKLGLKGLPKEMVPNIKNVLLERGHLLIPLVAIIYLLVSGYTPMRAALVAIILSVVASMLRKNTRIKLIDIPKALEAGARGALSVVAATACAGIIIGVVTLTGVGLKLGTALVDLAKGNLLITLFFTMLTSLILGMGVPTTANYVITSTIAAPALLRLGVPILAAHMFVFYFGIIADVTPPVALAAMAGAGIARANPFKTGLTASKLAIAAFLVPYAFVLSPDLLIFYMKGPIHLIWALITCVVGLFVLSGGLAGYVFDKLGIISRICYSVGGILLVVPEMTTDLVGAGLIVLAFVIEKVRTKFAKA
ncbi:TRAP transporter permease [Pseudothermotoga thermarum]|uniref:TRAP transporter, 4TM/12TM fusion protein n=1 Tax=Pseudothermotoga thermarum DSM 5069 TaxID=688269 RepID=F7YWT3_9THEM|nr:TRAP transporter permease [Pseudothermotoga thermarum]AEH50322.1 TRAP transporter, 4TM/12TM fusion protein [Pseudothermotoga thermarum DSM 5069]